MQPEAGVGPEVSVVVVNFNGGEYLCRCLRQLAAQDFADFEVLVLDNASSDGSFELAQAALSDQRFRFVPMDTNLGFAAANNRGAAMASGRWLACLNPDAFPHSDWLTALLRAAKRHPMAGMFASRQLDAARPELLDGAGDCYHAFGLAWRGGHGRPAPAVLPETQVFGACGAAALYDRKQFLELGGFAEDFFCYFEDVDLAFRWRLAGGYCIFAPDAVVEHVGGACSGGVSGFARYHGTRNAVWCFLRNMPGPLLWLLPAHLALMLALLVWGAARGHGGVVARALRDAVTGLPKVWRQRRQIQAGRRASWSCLAGSLVWSPTALLSRPIQPQTGQRAAWLETLALPIVDLAHEAVAELSPTRPAGTVVTELTGQIMLFAKFLVRLLPGRSAPVPTALDGKALFFATSRNQKDCLLAVATHLGRRAELITDQIAPPPFAPASPYLAALPFLPVALWRVATAERHLRTKLAHDFHQVWLAYGYCLVARALLRRLRPALLVVANDHSMRPRALLHAARTEGILTAYVQHASIGGAEPPLNTAYAFLEGQDSLEKYRAVGPVAAQVFLSGPVKLGPPPSVAARVTRVGLCPGLFDNPDRLAPLTAALRTRLPGVEFSLRLHPRQAGAGWHDAAAALDIPLGAPSDVNAFLATVDAVVAGDSNILLEALHANRGAVYFDGGGGRTDQYGFFTAGLFAYTDDPTRVAEALAHHPDDFTAARERARRYYDTIGTPAQGHSAERVAELLADILSGEQCAPPPFRLAFPLESR